MTEPASDAELLHRFTARRDEAAFRALAERHTGLVYHTALRRSGDAETAREVCQAVFLLLAEKAARLDASGGLAGWLHRAATLQARNAARAEGRRQNALHAMMRSGVSENGDGVSASAADSFHPALPHLDEAVERLPARDREVLLAHYYTGRTYREIAELRRETEAAVQRRASRALGKLATALRRRAVGGGGFEISDWKFQIPLLATGLAAALQTPAPAGITPPAPPAATAGAGMPWSAVLGRAAVVGLAGVCATAAGYAAGVRGNTVPVSRSVAGSDKTASPAGPLESPRPLDVESSGPAGDWRSVLEEAARDLRNPGDPLAKARAAWRLSALEPGEFDGALQWALTLPKDDIARVRLGAVLLMIQATRDPAAAWAALGAIPPPERGKDEPVDRPWEGPTAEAGEWVSGVFLKFWDRDPAAAVASLEMLAGYQKEIISQGARTIQASAPDRAKWMTEVEKTPSNEIREKGAGHTLRWGLITAAETSAVLNWIMDLPFDDPARRARLVRLATENGEECEPAVSAWLRGLEGQKAEAARRAVVDSLAHSPEEIRIRFAGAVKDAAVKQALLKSL